ncbi:MAG: PASTA domain-containing protein [Clostridiales bacterium]|jgi:beta-lactam-binding protein with PASTA domain|nr:PASTA domain-containing protein [Clostridiales bacterium]
MDTNNPFFDSYKKKMEEQKTDDHKTSSSETDKQTGLRFEERNGFVKPERTDTRLPVKTPAKNRKIIAYIAGSILLVCVITGIFLLLNRGIEMIQLVGWTESDAQLWARNNGVMLQISKEYNDEYEEGVIFSQNIPEGTRIKKGDFVAVTVSLGHDLSVTLPIPDFLSMTKEEIEAWAAENYMTRVRITTEHSDTIETGKVIRFEINDDRVVNEVRRDSPIYVIISKGPEETSKAAVEIPNFKIMSIAEAYAFADENGLVLTIEEEYDDFAPQGSIISQSIKAEEKVPEGTEINLVVSKGKVILVPDFSKVSKEMAASVAGEKGILITINERYSGQPAGQFISQSVKPDTVYEQGTIVELYYSIDNRIAIPSFIGQTRDAIESWAKELNQQGASISIKATSTRSNQPPGTILTQSKANTLIKTNASISITVSSGRVIYAPDFVAPAGSGYDLAMTREKALAICEELNIIPIFVEEHKSGRLPGEIWYQSIAAGKEMNEGSTITLKHAPANVQLTVPDFTKMTQEEILAKNYHRSFDIRFTEGPEYKEGYEGKVYEQSLKAGTKTASGSVITLTLGPKQISSDPGNDLGES